MNKEEFNGVFEMLIFFFFSLTILVSYSSTDSESSSSSGNEDENWYETGVPVQFLSTGIATTGNNESKDTDTQEQAIERSLADNLSYSGHKKILDNLEDSVSQGMKSLLLML